MRLEELRKELKARNAKVSGRKHELMDRCVLFIRMAYCRASCRYLMRRKSENMT